MAKNYRGAAERGVDRRIADGQQEIWINWINMSAKELGSGGADRITRKLIEAGVHVACVRYNNTHHDFMMLNALAETTPTRAAVAQAAAALKKMLH